MALRNAVMAALLEGEASGYDLAKGFDATVANFWMSTPQQLYRELERMEAAGLVTARVVEQERRPNKRLFSLTEAGRDAVHAYTAEPLSKPAVVRDELMVKVQCLDSGDIGAVRKAITERMEWATAKLARYERLRQRLLDGRSEEAYFTEAERIGPYLTLLRGMSFERENLQWGAIALRRLDQRAAALQTNGKPGDKYA
ncbi:PadR family transcriptional regulator [Streptomyces europaeiscabiei]|uniref:PadR family transcriptional regulator n=1 Tax=Streptomyces europaeiscabiei TaxID=146819 RepID=A0ABU4NTD6_9ACTN|nr:PadR family transcriptional regulator [Streptomyces europaeiscabiei]MDX2524648.1 PadR family transcriptional regulator [Streptomyces europaeiscabiei]MDX2765230.1 PadR family transcriptional regulator [Streptomyces europaeiscabiei]MDX2769174.1 PadR family transcriptional regulator [Streptomyces europaeiscabiei]MDX3548529.1 PadR family transcriptional regulator [Streptomyces europaeiscabiei]MDX3558172.1 PadR family transcriptional regulator [Streptomyces europaeiscabiei]